MENRNKTVFRLSPGMLAEDLREIFPETQFYPGENRQTLEGVRFYSESCPPEEQFIYMMDEDQLKKLDSLPQAGAFIISGDCRGIEEFGDASVICIPSGLRLDILFNHCLDIFQKHREWAEKLKDIILHKGTIDELCVVSYEYFGNPMFVHDPQLYIIACPIWREGMVKWDKDEVTGAISAPAELLNEFRLDSEYQETLNTSKAQFFSAELRGHRDLYVNLWNEYGGYMGRLVIVELESRVREGHKLAAEYLAELIRDVLLGYGNMQEVYSRAFDLLLERLLKGAACSEEEIEERVSKLGWSVHDRYSCISLYSESNADGHFFNISTCNYLEAAIAGSHAFLTDGRICLLINRRVNPEYHSVMIEVLRDHLLMAGISNEFKDLSKLRVYYKQAQIALDSCLERKEIRWYTPFSEITVEFILDQAEKEMGAAYLCDPVLPLLDEYDRVNGTELLKTLKTYILNERNTVQSSKALYIGRSTLFYRLRTIAELTGLDGERMADPERNLYLRVSVCLWDRK